LNLALQWTANGRNAKTETGHAVSDTGMLSANGGLNEVQIGSY